MLDVSAFLRMQELKSLEESYAILRADHDDISFLISQNRPIPRNLSWNDDRDFVWNYSRYSRPIAEGSLSQIERVSRFAQEKCTQIHLTSTFRNSLCGSAVSAWVDREDRNLQGLESLAGGLSLLFHHAVEYEEKKARPVLVDAFYHHYKILNDQIGRTLTDLAEILTGEKPPPVLTPPHNVFLETILQADRRHHQLLLEVGHGHLEIAAHCHDLVALLDGLSKNAAHASNTPFGHFVRSNRSQTMSLAGAALDSVESLSIHLRQNLELLSPLSVQLESPG